MVLSLTCFCLAWRWFVIDVILHFCKKILHIHNGMPVCLACREFPFPVAHGWIIHIDMCGELVSYWCHDFHDNDDVDIFVFASAFGNTIPFFDLCGVIFKVRLLKLLMLQSWLLSVHFIFISSLKLFLWRLHICCAALFQSVEALYFTVSWYWSGRSAAI